MTGVRGSYILRVLPPSKFNSVACYAFPPPLSYHPWALLRIIYKPPPPSCFCSSSTLIQPFLETCNQKRDSKYSCLSSVFFFGPSSPLKEPVNDFTFFLGKKRQEVYIFMTWILPEIKARVLDVPLEKNE